MRALIIIALAILAYAMLYLTPAVVAPLLQPPAQQNGYSPYTMYQRCHPAQFHIPPGNC